MIVTTSATKQLLAVCNEDGKQFVRFGVQGGGCHGFQYFLQVVDSKEEDDMEVALDDTCSVIVDHMSWQYVVDAEIDYETSIMGSVFKFNNPHVKSTCGCNSSVSF